MSKTATVPDPEATMTADELASAYAAAAYAASQGDTVAAIRLARIEERIDTADRAERREAAAKVEGQRLAVEAQEKTAADARAVNEQAHAKFLEQRDAVYAVIEDLTGKLATEVQLCLAVDQELWASSLRCGWSPERRTKARITAYISSQLGGEGAGLSDLPSTYGVLRESSLVQPSTKES